MTTNRTLSKTEEKAIEYLQSLAGLAQQVAIDVLGVDPERATILGEEVAGRVSVEHCGQQFYIGAKTRYMAYKADQAIYKRFIELRRDYAATARDTKVSTRHIYRVIKRTEQRDRDERQGKLLINE